MKKNIKLRERKEEKEDYKKDENEESIINKISKGMTSEKWFQQKSYQRLSERWNKITRWKKKAISKRDEEKKL